MSEQQHESEHPSRWAAMVSIAAKFGCSPHTPREWVQKVDRDNSRLPSTPAGNVRAVQAPQSLRLKTTQIRGAPASSRPVRRVTDFLPCGQVTC